MAPPEKALNHRKFTDEWFKVASADLAPENRRLLLEKAVHVLWSCAHGPLSDVTLKAIFDRVLLSASCRYPELDVVKVSDSGVSFKELSPQAFRDRETELEKAFQFIIVEFLSIAGSLTDQVITPRLHSRLFTVSLKKRANP